MNLFKYVQKFIDIYNHSLGYIEKKVLALYELCYQFFMKYAKPWLDLVIKKIDDFQVKYLGKGQLGNHVLVRYICK